MAGLRLPNETWIQIVRDLPYPHQIPLLHVSRKFHDIVIRFLFSTVKIYFLGKQFKEIFDDMDETVERTMQKSCEILYHIAQNSTFARAVKTLSVIAYADSSSVFEKLCLERALRAIPNLRTFYWFGIHPELTHSLVECLPRSLQALHTQSIPLMKWPSHLGSINHLELETTFYDPLWGSWDDLDRDYWNNLSNTNYIAATVTMVAGLQYLSLLSHHVGTMPLYVYNSLKELEVCILKDSDMIGMDLIFHHLPFLESLSLVGHMTSEVFTLLPQNSTSLPSLKSFRLSIEPTALSLVGEEHLLLLSGFLGHHANLRRLCLRLAEANWNTLSAVLPIIRSLQTLEVLGFHAGHQCMNTGDFQMLASVLAPNLTAIHLAIPWNYLDSANINVNTLAPLLYHLRELSRLEFIYFHGIGGNLPLDPDEFTAELEQLQTIGFNHTLWDVDGVEVVQWEPLRVQSAIREDFRCEDHAWLFKYHR